MGVLCTWVKLLTDLQIFGCELHKNAFGGRAPSRHAGWRYSSPQDLLAVIRGVEGGKGKERVGKGKGKEGEEGEGREGLEGVGRDVKREEG